MTSVSGPTGEADKSPIHDISPIEPLSKLHDLAHFDCGAQTPLNVWLKKHALQNQFNDSARTYVAHRAMRVVAYYAIAAGSISTDDATPRAIQGLARHPVPVAVLARLAVHRDEQGRGLGRALLKDALLRIEQAAEILGIRAVLVNAIDTQARAFYERFEFEPCPGDQLRLMLLMKDLRHNLRS